MSAYAPYQAYPGPPPALVSPPPILVAAADPAPQRRLTVAFRLLLAIPHAFVLYWLGIAAAFVAFLGWWAALFTGRLPQFAVTYLSGYLRWSTRLCAYDLLLTDVYPPFSFEEEAGYPVRLAIPEPQRLNRAAVFFRFFLILPVGLLAGIVAVGAGTLMAFVAWLVTLIAGRLPVSFHLAYVAVLRFQARVHGYWTMLTPAYPGALYGDKPGVVAGPGALPPSPAEGSGTPPAGFGTAAPGGGAGSGAPGYGASGYGAPGGYQPGGYGTPSGPQNPPGYGPPAVGYGTPAEYGPAAQHGTPAEYGAPAPYGAPAAGYGAPAGYGASGWPGTRPAWQPATWLLPLSTGARRLLTVFVVLGAVLLVAYVALYSVLIGSAVNGADNTQLANTALSQLNTSATTLSNQVASVEQATASCDHNLTCVTAQDRELAGDFSTFSSELGNMSVPLGAQADQVKLGALTDLAAQNLTQVSKATTFAQYESVTASTGVVQTLNGWDQAVNTLGAELQSY